MKELKIMQNNHPNFGDGAGRTSMLKFKNFDSYLYGDTQLVYFVELRKFLRDKKPLEFVFLTMNLNEMTTASGGNTDPGLNEPKNASTIRRDLKGDAV